MWKQDPNENLKLKSVEESQVSLGMENTKKKLSFGKQGQACCLNKRYEEKDYWQTLKSKEEQKNFELAENQSFLHLKTRQTYDIQYIDNKTLDENQKISDQIFKGNIKKHNKSTKKYKQIKNIILKDSDSISDKRSSINQTTQISFQKGNQKILTNKIQEPQQQKLNNLQANFCRNNSISRVLQEEQDQRVFSASQQQFSCSQALKTQKKPKQIYMGSMQNKKVQVEDAQVTNKQMNKSNKQINTISSLYCQRSFSSLGTISEESLQNSQSSQILISNGRTFSKQSLQLNEEEREQETLEEEESRKGSDQIVLLFLCMAILFIVYLYLVIRHEIVSL